MDPQNSQKKKQLLTDYGKYAGIALQMGAIIALGVWGGVKIDEKVSEISFPLFTIIFSLFSVFAAMYFVVKEVFKK